MDFTWCGERNCGFAGALSAAKLPTRTRLRTHWNNQETGLVDDAVFELKMGVIKSESGAPR